MQEPFDTPYGRMALVAGPQGETFSVMRLASGSPEPSA
jgi:predicted enzyme related to lactoylglutathione lyase